MKTLSNRELGASLRIIDRDGEPWFVARDILDTLGIEQTHKAIEKLDEDEVHQIPLIDSIGRKQMTYVVSESGLYMLILRSDKPAAKVFRKWVTSVVLPEIRRTGSFIGGWEGELRKLEADCTAGRALLLEAETRLRSYKREVAARLGLSIPDHSPILLGRNRYKGERPTPLLLMMAKELPFPALTGQLVKYLMEGGHCRQDAAYARLRRMYACGLITQGPDRLVRLQSMDSINTTNPETYEAEA